MNENSSIYPTIGARIKALRKELSLTQDELAQRINSTKQNISKYERGVITNIPFDKLLLIANALETTPSYLLGLTNESDYVEPLESFIDFLPSIGILHAGGIGDEIVDLKTGTRYFFKDGRFLEIYNEVTNYIKFLFTQEFNKSVCCQLGEKFVDDTGHQYIVASNGKLIYCDKSDNINK